MEDMFDPRPDAPRPLGEALLKGWRRRCPHCGGGALFDGYLTVRDSCDICGEALHHHRADDAPSWLTIMITGHLIAPFMILAYEFFDLPTWAHVVAWPVIAMTMVVILLPRVKGGVVAFQWANRMHGFDKARAPAGH
ncbi:MAG: DUF983 domain-containing protein [Pikeienuella sp.]